MARIKLAYPKIPGSKHSPAGRCVAFEKYDGTNFHWVWERELGWYAFGMRRSQFDFDEVGIAEFHAAHPGMEDATSIFRNELAKPLEAVFRENPSYSGPELTVFTEYVGAESFAGTHKAGDPKRLVLFDVQTEEGIIGPDQFLKDFSTLNIARVVYRGKLTGAFTTDVREGAYGVKEGVVCKGGSGDGLWMVKIKTNAYMQRLKDYFKGDWQDYWE